MAAIFYLSGALAVISTLMAITRRHPIHGLLYLLVSLFATAVVFLVLGAPFAAALEVIVYAGAIIVLFVFVVMLLNLGPEAARRERSWLRPGMWIGPGLISGLLGLELFFLLLRGQGPGALKGLAVEPRQVGIALFSPTARPTSYVLGVELASMLLLAALVGAYHLGKRSPAGERAGEGHGIDTHGARPGPGGSPVPAGADRSAGPA